MDIMQAMRTAIQEWVVPEFDKLRLENAENRSALPLPLQLTNKRLDDQYVQLVDQRRRIDETNKRIDETNKRIDEMRKDLVARIDDTNKRIDDTNQRMDRLYEVIVRREEHEGVVAELRALKQRVEVLERKLAA